MDSRLRFCSPSNTPTRHTLGQWWRKKKEAKKKRTVKTNKPTPGRSRNGRHRHTHTKRKGAATAGGPATVRRPADRADPRFEPTRGSSRPAGRAKPPLAVRRPVAGAGQCRPVHSVVRSCHPRRVAAALRITCFICFFVFLLLLHASSSRPSSTRCAVCLFASAVSKIMLPVLWLVSRCALS